QEKSGVSLDALDLGRIGLPTDTHCIFLHGVADRVAPESEARGVAEGLDNASFVRFGVWGHQRILSARGVIERGVAFALRPCLVREPARRTAPAHSEVRAASTPVAGSAVGSWV